MRLSFAFLSSLIFLSSSFQAIPARAQQQAGQDAFWQTRCVGVSRSAGALSCEATQSIRVKESGQLIFKIDIIYPGQEAAPVFQMQAPLGFYLPGKIKLSVDGENIAEMSINTCDQRGCFLTAAANDDMINAMKKGGKLEIDFAPAADRRQKMEVPLTGFSRAMDAIQ